MAKKDRFIEHIQPIAEKVKGNLTPNVLKEINEMMRRKELYLLYSLNECESPIEQLYCLHLINSIEWYQSDFREIDSHSKIRVLIQKDVEFKHKKYRPDFIILCYALGKEFKFAIECDGHDYHEKTKEQAKRDKSRDRDLQSLGFRVIHFTGSEIFSDPKKCVCQTFDIIQTTTGLEDKIKEDV
ncbi:MAG: DUF559 domain-containing protein [Bacillota bacterium]|nr:DUF559 domain-containing protein [Bacillota bacterium]